MHPLETKLNAVRRRVRRLTIVHGASRWAMVVVATTVGLGLADWLVRYQDQGLRWMALLALTGAGGWAAWRFLWPAIVAGWNPVALAARVEQRLPLAGERLASAVRFLGEREDDPLAGSPALRRAVIAQATAEIANVNLGSTIDPRPTYRGAAAAVVVCSAALALFAVDPASASIAFVRLVAPWSDTAWPRANHLAFTKPVRKLAVGQVFEVELRDAAGAALPDEVLIHYRPLEEEGQETVERMRPIDGAMVARREGVSGPFAYRASGGDDQAMPWIEVAVVEPPAIEELAVRLEYPAYTGWPAESSGPHLRALAGTHVVLTGRATKPLRSARVRVGDGEAVAAQVSDDGLRLSVPSTEGPPFVIERSGSWRLELVDDEGFTSSDQAYEIRAVEDLPPSVDLERPQATSYVTPQADIPLRVSVRDDLAIHEVGLRYSRGDKSADPDAELSLFLGPPRTERSGGAGAASEARAGETRNIEYLWKLEPLALPPGTEVNLQATATDYHPHLGLSRPRRLIVVTPDELQERLVERHNGIVNDLTRLLKIQRESRGQVSGAEIQLVQVGRLDKREQGHLQAAELTQRQVERGLTGSTESVAAQVAGLLADVQNSKVDSPDLARQMEALQAELRRLERDELPPISRDLTAAIKAMQNQSPQMEQADNRIATALASAAKHQDEVVRTLESLTADLGQWDDYRRVHREISGLRREQQQLTRRSAELAQQTLTHDLKDLTAQQRADLAKAAAVQHELARRLDTAEDRMRRMAAELGTRDPLASGALSDALEFAAEQAISGAMRQAGKQIEENRLGQVADVQRRMDEQLEEMLDILSNRREHELGRLVKKLREMESQLAALRDEQAGLRKKWQAATSESAAPEKRDTEKRDVAQRRQQLERLTREQESLAQQVQRLARRLERVQADEAGRNAARSGAKMAEAGRQGQQGDAADAARQAGEAQHDLEQAQAALAERLAQAEADLAQEQLGRLDDQLRAVHDQQQRLLDETQAYGRLAAEHGGLSRAEAISVGDLGRQQRDVALETHALAEKLSGTPVFELALSRASRDMHRAADGLDERRLGEETEWAERRALDLITQALDALRPPANNELQAEPDGSAGGDGDDQGGDGQPAGDQSQADALRQLAELKLLKWLQDEVNQRTKALEETYGGRQNLSREEKREYLELSHDQGQIAELVRGMTEAAQAEAEQPEQLPDLDDDSP